MDFCGSLWGGHGASATGPKQRDRSRCPRMGSRSTRHGLGADYRHMSYSACPCPMCAPGSRTGKRYWKRLLHKSARARGRRIVAAETRALRHDDA
jgi:hypothetical protein